MNESFAIQGYSANNQMLCLIEGNDIYQTDYFGNKKAIGKIIAAYTELEQTTTEYYNKLVELGVITVPQEPEEIMAQMQQSMLEMSSIIKSLSQEVKELKNNGSERNCKCGKQDVPKHRSDGSREQSTIGVERNAGFVGECIESSTEFGDKPESSE